MFPIYTDPNKTLLLLKAHEVHSAGCAPASTGKRYLKWQDDAAWRVAQGTIPSCERRTSSARSCCVSPTSYIGWNGDKPLFSDVRVRTAMTLALNRQDIIDNIYVGFGKLATGPYPRRHTRYNDPDVDRLDFDLDAARSAARRSGLGGQRRGRAAGLRDLSLGDGDAREPFEFTLLILRLLSRVRVLGERLQGGSAQDRRAS